MSMDKNFERWILVAGGHMDVRRLVKLYQEEQRQGSCGLLGVDSGALSIDITGLSSDAVIGDFDSVTEEEKRRILASCPEQLVLNPIKDDTDMEAAVHFLIGKKPKHVTVLGATGSRLDHTMTNLRLLVLFEKAGIPAVLENECNRVRVISGDTVLKKENCFGTYISLLPVEGPVRSVTMTGFKYETKDITLEPFSSLGVSNELVSEEGEIRFSGGMLYLMETRDG